MPMGGPGGGPGGPGGFGGPRGERMHHHGPGMGGPGMPPPPRRGCCMNGCLMPFVFVGGIIALIVTLL